MPVLAKNKRVLRDFHVLEEYEAGIVLSGQEAKAAKAGTVSLKGSYVKIMGSEAFLINAAITRYEKAAPDDSYDPRRTRKLLLRKKEIARLIGRTQEKGLTLLPISLYTKAQFVKVKFGLTRKKKQHDKRQDIKDRQARRDIARNLKLR